MLRSSHAKNTKAIWIGRPEASKGVKMRTGSECVTTKKEKEKKSAGGAEDAPKTEKSDDHTDILLGKH
jgi:hypothetical protein